MKVNADIVAYVEREIIPRYATFDKAHREDHARMVIEQSLLLAEKMPETNADMVYIVAAYHDLGLTNGRTNHHRDSRLILEADPFLQAHFTPEQMSTMGCAVEDHRASLSSCPRNSYGLIVAEADRFINADTIIRRTVQYGLSHYPELDRNGHRQRAMQHLQEKYGRNGYLKIWIPWSENARRLQNLQTLLDEPQKLDEIFERIFTEETD